MSGSDIRPDGTLELTRYWIVLLLFFNIRIDDLLRSWRLLESMWKVVDSMSCADHLVCVVVGALH